MLVYSKQLTYAVRIVSKEKFNEAKTQALDCYREQQRFLSQRHSLQLEAHRQANLLSKVFHDDVTASLYLDEEEITLALLQTQLDSLQQSNDILLKDVESAEYQVEAVTRENNGLLETKTLVKDSLKSSVEELTQLTVENSVLQSQVRDREETCQRLQRIIDDHANKYAFFEEKIFDLATHLQGQLTGFRQEYLLNTDHLQQKEELFRQIILSGAGSGSGSGPSLTAGEETVGERNKADSLKKLLGEVLEDIHEKNNAWYQLVLHLNDINEHLQSLTDYS
jgi:FtsZ-binding cell division protein ZapB